jgi:hypothetical protein
LVEESQHVENNKVNHIMNKYKIKSTYTYNIYTETQPKTPTEGSEEFSATGQSRLTEQCRVEEEGQQVIDFFLGEEVMTVFKEYASITLYQQPW